MRGQVNSKGVEWGPRTKWEKGKVAVWDMQQSLPHLHNVTFSENDFVYIEQNYCKNKNSYIPASSDY